MRGALTLAGLLLVGSVPAAEVEPFTLAGLKQLTQRIGTELAALRRSTADVAALRRQLVQAKALGRRQKLVARILARREHSIAATQRLLAHLDEAIAAAAQADAVQQAALDFRGYLRSLRGLTEDLAALQARAEAGSAPARGRAMGQAIERVRGSLGVALERVAAWDPTDKLEQRRQALQTALRSVRAAMALRQTVQLYDYRLTAAVHGQLAAARSIEQLERLAYGELDPAAHLPALARAGVRVQNWGATLNHVLQQVHEQDAAALDWPALQARLRRHFERVAEVPPPPPQRVGDTLFLYDPERDRYYAPGSEPRRWAPYDYRAVSGAWVRYHEHDGNWYSHHPRYGDAPRRLRAEGESL